MLLRERYIDRSVAVHGYAVRLEFLMFSERLPFGDKTAVRCQFLDAVVHLIRHINRAFDVRSQTDRLVKMQRDFLNRRLRIIFINLS